MPHSFGGSVTVSGLQLRAERVHSDGTAAVCGVLDDIVELGDTVQCLASALWDAEGSLYDVMRAVQVTVGGVVGTSTEAFSFDAPVASFAATECAAERAGVCDSERAAASG